MCVRELKVQVIHKSSFKTENIQGKMVYNDDDMTSESETNMSLINNGEISVSIYINMTIPFEKEQQSPTAKEMERVKSIKIMRFTGCFLANTISGHSTTNTHMNSKHHQSK